MKRTGWIAWILVAALLALSSCAYLVLRSKFATIRGSEMNVDRAVFNVTNAVTLTGFQLTTTVNDYPLPAQLTIFVLIAAGSFVSMLVGGWAVTRAMGLPHEDKSIALASLVLWLLAVIIGGATVLEDYRFGAAIFNGASLFGNSGLWIGTVPQWDIARTQAVLLPLAVIGGLGVPVLLNLGTSIVRFRRPHAFTLDVLAASALVYLLGTLIICWIETSPEVPRQRAFLLGSTEVLNNRSLGLPMESFGELSRPSQWVCLVLILIGANPGGTGGGMMAVFVFMFLRGIFQIMRGKTIAPLFGLISLWMTIYVLAAFAATLLLIEARPQGQTDRLLFLAVSAIGNAGTSHDPLTLTGTSLYILSGAMLFGRLAPLAMLWWAAKFFLPQVSPASPPLIPNDKQA